MAATTKKPAAKKAAKKPALIPVHQWTDANGEILIVRFSDKEGRSSSYRLQGGQTVTVERFQHPMKVGESVTAPDWDSAVVCGGGIHGWPWGMSLGAGKDCEWDALWQVYGVKPEDIIELDGGKVKFRTGVLRFMGRWDEATAFVLKGQMAWVAHRASGAASATGASGAASATGGSGAASATGESGAASATGDASAAVVTGVYGKARAGKFGCIALSWWNEKKQRAEMRCSLVGDGHPCKADTWYTLDAVGNFVEVR